MKKLEKVASDDGRVLGTQVHEELPGAGWISRISLGVRALVTRRATPPTPIREQLASVVGIR